MHVLWTPLRAATGHHGGAVIISHDRYLLDRLCDRIVEIEHTKVASFPGNYTSHTKAKEIRLLSRQRQLQKDTEFIKKEQVFATLLTPSGYGDPDSRWDMWRISEYNENDCAQEKGMPCSSSLKAFPMRKSRESL